MNQTKNKIVLALIIIVVISTGVFLAFNNHSLRSPVNNQNNITVRPAKREIKAKLIINNGKSQLTYDEVLPVSSTVFDLLKQSSRTNNFSLKYQPSQMGVFVEAIAGVKNDNATNKYWLYKVNGKLANVGASGYVMQNNDVIEWYYGTVTDFK